MAQIEQLSSMSNSSTGIFEFIKTYYPEYVGDNEYPVSESVFFHKKTDDHWILSNMSAAPLVVEGVNFWNSEHLFHVVKFCLQLKYEQSLEFRNELDSTNGSYIGSGGKPCVLRIDFL